MPGIHIPYAAIFMASIHMPYGAISLRGCYDLPGTHIASTAICLCTYDAISGTNLAYGAMRCAVLTSRMLQRGAVPYAVSGTVVPYRAKTLCIVRYLGTSLCGTDR
eukprot:2604657-Rhodomonas_salina.1